ncbi:MAG TPA: Hsp70 family protein [Clostridiales bacterium]|nr:Hsp70 family protein [Clostridiales bacterium]
MVIGIDLGTTNSAVAYVDKSGTAQIIPNREGQRTTPSVILFNGDVQVVGEAAKSNSIIDPLNVVQFVKRNIGNENFCFDSDDGEEYRAEELSAVILKRLKEDAEDFLGEAVTQAVITVPAYFDDAQRKATIDAGKIAGLDVLAIINEPTAAALAYGIDKSEKQRIMVYDLGGGTFDVTIMEISENDVIINATCGDRNLGGFDVDNTIMMYVSDYVSDEYGLDLMDDENAMQDLRLKAESLKKALSSREKASISMMAMGKPIKLEFTRDQLFDMIKDKFLDRTTDIMELAKDDAGIHWSDISKILLVGGSSRMPAIRQVIKDLTGIEPSAEVNPDEVVAIGAAYYASSLNPTTVSKARDKKIIDVNSHSLGVITHDDNDNPVNTIILHRNQPIPAKSEQIFYTQSDNQNRILIQVTEGEDEDIDYVKIIGTSELRLNPHPAGSQIRIGISYDKDGIVHVDVFDLEDNIDLGEMNIERKSNLSQEEIDKSKDKLDKMKID